jgi:hypothetical protein
VTEGRRVWIVFCRDPLNPREVDSAFVRESEVALRHGATLALIDDEALVAGDAARAIRRVPETTGAPAVYRGWMLDPTAYTALYESLLSRGLALVNTPEQYVQCHYLPASYDVIAGHTPETVWLAGAAVHDESEIHAALARFGTAPVIVKDFVKSRKHEWLEACFIPSAADVAAVRRVVRTFLERQGGDLAGGLVFRRFVRFKPIGVHPKSGMPLSREFRRFYFHGDLLAQFPYWEAGDDGDAPPADLFADVARSVRSRFFTMDLAQQEDGRWLIVELGDGQVAGLPERADVDSFYAALVSRAESA